MSVCIKLTVQNVYDSEETPINSNNIALGLLSVCVQLKFKLKYYTMYSCVFIKYSLLPFPSTAVALSRLRIPYYYTLVTEPSLMPFVMNCNEHSLEMNVESSLK